MDAETVRFLAHLARLRLTDAEQQRAAVQMGQLLEAFHAIAEVPTEGIEPSAYPLPLTLRLRPDEAGETLAQDEALANAPDARAGCFRVPRVVEG